MESSILMLVLMFVILYFLMIRPENKRKKKAQEMRDGLKKGDVITSIGGIVGKIVMVNSDTIIIETSEDRVRMELTKWAVSTVGVQTGEQPAEEKGKKGKKKDAESSDVPEEPTAPEEPVDEIPAPEEEKKD
ncbi:preprotein translocase subunit YajC [Dysosmobacter sp.]|uniref:preprotein translocase subunit YajC n=1 Tax=Dysosmobacter sp. TaxID=2591382 RepID=UPI002A872BFB|nr:preprotein translocase subunit YajC [Dysosmobacter sp.]MDY3984955.1 preprotein translocase subunit YajC [Dysosmobacter sp.]